MPDYTREPKGVLPLSPIEEKGVVFNLRPYQKEIQAIQEDNKEELRYRNNINWMWREAIRHPGERMRFYFEENRWEDQYWAEYHTEDMSLHTNMWGWCPNRYGHHLYETCRVCGQKG